MILVTGAAGKTGLAVMRAVAARGQAVRALVRRQDQARAAQASGAREVIAGDLREAGALSRAMRGVRKVYHICPNVHPDEVAIGRAVLAAADAAGVEHFVYHSVLHPQTEAMPHHWRKLRVEEALFESGIAFTIVQPAAYMQNVQAQWASIVERGVYRVPYSIDAPFSLVDLADVAQAAAAILVEPGHAGATCELAGPEVLTPASMADALAGALGRPVRAERESVAAWADRAAASGMPAHAVETLSRMFRYYDLHGLWGNSRMLTALLGRPPATFESFARRAAQAASS